MIAWRLLDYYINSVYIDGMKILLYSSNSKNGQYKTIEKEISRKLLAEGYILTVYNSTSNLKTILNKMAQAELCLFECSSESIELGLLIQKTLEMEKPVIALYSQSNEPSFAKLITNEKFQYFKYTKTNWDSLLGNALQKAALLTDRRFNFFVNSSMLAYLTKISKRMGVTKSTFIRNLIEEYRRKNP